MQTLPLLIIAAGVAQFGILTASALVPRVLDWRSELAKVPPLMRDLVWVHGAYIVLMIVGFGALSVALPHELIDGSVLARVVTGFIALFWGARLALQFALFRPQQYLRTTLLRVAYHSLTVTFGFLAAVYSLAAGLGGSGGTP